MSTTTAMEHIAPAAFHVRRTRVLGVAGAMVAAVAVWIVAVPVLGTQLVVRFGDSAPQSVDFGFVVGGSLAAALLGWGLLVVLERFTSNARMIWTGLAIAVLAGSLSLPLGAGTTESTKVALALMHVAAAGVLVPALRRR
jgi:hypothetical protein